MEIWKSVDGYDGKYSISSLGKVKTNERVVSNGKGIRTIAERLLVQHDNGHGYKYVCFRKNGKTKHEYVHRLVAMAFINNVDGKPEVHHKDNDSSNNCVKNLSWVTRSENVSTVNHKMAYKAALGTPIKATKNNEIIYFNAIRDVVEMGFTRKYVQDSLHKRRTTYKGYTWEYSHKH